MASRQGREELIKKGLLEMMEQGECEGRPGGAGCRARGRRAGRLVDPGASPGRNGSREAGIPRRPGPRGASTAGGVPESCPMGWAPGPQSPAVSARPPPPHGAQS